MHIREIFAAHPTTFSFEFFPPKTDAAWDDLFAAIVCLQGLEPSFVSVTYGAGGSTRERTHDLLVRIQQETNLTAVSHLTSVCHTRRQLTAILDRYAKSGIENVLALRGDPPRDLPDYDRANDAFKFAAEMVKFVRKHSHGFGIGVAGFPEGHPDCPNRLKELDHLKSKVDAGADYICTQLFFDNHDFYDFRDRCDRIGIKVPIVAGIMPITSRGNLVRMAELAAGSRIPAALLRAVDRCETDDDVARVGTLWATSQCFDLLNNQVRGLHFYTLNKSAATREIYANLGVKSSAKLR